MTKNKRFTINTLDGSIDLRDNGKVMTYKGTVDLLNELHEENEQLKQCIKEIDDAELHLKQIILKRIDDYIWEWEDEGTPVAQVLQELKKELKGDD